MAVESQALAPSVEMAVAADAVSPARLRECQHCGQLQVLPPMPPASRAVCLRCDAVLRHTQHDPIGVPLALNITALVLFFIATSNVLLTVSRAGQSHLADLFTGPVGIGADRLVGTVRRRGVHHLRRAARQGAGDDRGAAGRATRPLRPPAARPVRLGGAFAAVVDDRGLSAGGFRRLCAARRAGAYRAGSGAVCARRADADHGNGRRNAGCRGGLGGAGPPPQRNRAAGAAGLATGHAASAGLRHMQFRHPHRAGVGLSAMRLSAARAQAEQHRAHLGAGDRRAAPVHSGQRLSRC